MSRSPRGRIAMVLAVGLLCLAACIGRAADKADDSQAAFASRVGPLVARYCHECHAGDAVEGDVNLASFGTPADMRKQIKVWQRVAEVVSGGQMPPPDAEQPTDEERRVLGDGLRDFLTAEARANAGDLTGVDSLEPVKEFPADGGAGEGFTNTGQSLVMSPSLATKYLDAAKGISAHAVLLPDGLRFSAGEGWRRLAKAGEGWRRLAKAGDAVATVARERGLSPKYLATLHAAVSAPEASLQRRPSAILDALRARWQTATAAAAAALTLLVSQWQSAVWKFNTVSQIVRQFKG